jgi:chromosomal replication initiator protein
MLTLARWVSTAENRSASVAVKRVADCVCSDRLRRQVNPLFLHGPPGTGKSHLVSILGTDVTKRCPDRIVQVLGGDELNLALRPGNGDSSESASEEVLASFLKSDLAIVENVQHLSAKAAAALVGLFDRRLGRRQAQMVFTASVGPGQLEKLPSRLTSRFASGLVVCLLPFSPASRLVFLTDRAQRRQLAIGRDVLAWLAKHTPGSGRQLEAAIHRLEAFVRQQDRLPELAAVTTHFRTEADTARPTVERIAQRVGSYFRVRTGDLQSRRRCRNALLPRQIGMYLARRLTPLSLEQIGAYFGGRDHSTVLHACRKVEQALSRDVTLSGAVRRLHADLA